VVQLTGAGQWGFRVRDPRNLSGDTFAALHFLKRHEVINPDRVGLIGQSEGGIITPIVASASDDVAFVVLLAGPAVSGLENLSLSFAMFTQASSSIDLAAGEFKRLLDRLLA
jgi:dienelactone hydrolase